MAVGQGFVVGDLSYLTFGRETTTATYNTCTAALDFLSSSFRTQKDTKILEQIETCRTFSKSIGLGKVVGGDVEFYFYPEITACAWILQNAFGGTVTAATSTAETTGAGAASAIDHTFVVGNFDQSFASLCVNTRKGDATNGKIFEYNGVRVNEMSFVSELDEPLRCVATMIGFDSTVTTNDVSANVTCTSFVPFVFNEGRFSVETSFASLQTSSYWHVQSFEFKVMNNLHNGSEARRIGSDILDVLPAGPQTYELSCNIRFDTTTAFDAMIAQTDLAGQFEFIATETMTGSNLQPALTFNFQKLRVKDAGDPEIGGPDEVLVSNVVFDVLRDESATGYAVNAVLRNQMSAIGN